MGDSSKIEIGKEAPDLIRDYFADLELKPDAGSEDVKRAYRRLARRFHPDLNPGDPYARESFRRIQEAYEFLIQSAKREGLQSFLQGQNLPVSLRRWKNEPHWHAEPSEFVDEWTLRDGEERSEDLNLHVMAEVDPALVSKPQRLQLKVLMPCTNCRGQGGASQSIQRTCKACAGLAYQLIRRGAFRWKKTCDECLGKGYQVVGACANCSGHGKINSQEEVDLEVSAESIGNEPVCYMGQGHWSFDGKRRGDLWVKWITKK